MFTQSIKKLALQIDLNLLVDQNSTVCGSNHCLKFQLANHPQISISKPSSNLCYTCQKNRLAIQKADYLSEEGKAELYKVAQDYIQRARTEREDYKSQIAAAEASWSASEDGMYIPTLGHYSYDFAQHIYFPFNA